MADMLATSTDAEDDTPFPSGTAEETCKFIKGCHIDYLNLACLIVQFDNFKLDNRKTPIIKP